MFYAHTVSAFAEGESIADGRSAILFATLAGVSIGLMTGGSRTPTPAGRAPLRLAIVLRGLALIVLGILLNLPDTYIAIILDYYGVMFLLVVPLMFLPRGALVAVGACLVFVGPLLAQVFTPVTATLTEQGNDLLVGVLGWLFDGYYPAFTWLVFLLAGLVCARSDIRLRSTQLWMLGTGTAAALVGYGAAALAPGVLDASAHSGAPAEIIGSGGLAIAVCGLLLIVTGRESGRPGTVVRVALWSVGAVGSMPLTVYTVQILVLGAVPLVADENAVLDNALPAFLILTVASLIGASVWRRLIGAGPLERLLRSATRPKNQVKEASPRS